VLALAHCRTAPAAKVEAIAETWPGPGDDRPYLEALEASLGLSAVRLEAREAAPWFLRSFSVDGQPQAFGIACADMLLWATSRSRGAEVALGGYGGDSICGGEISFAPLLLSGHPLRAIGGALRLDIPWRVSPMRRLDYWIARPLLRRAVPGPVFAAARRRRVRRTWMKPRLLGLAEPEAAQDSFSIPRSPDEWVEHWCDLPYFAELSVSWGQIAAVTGNYAVDVFRDLEFVRFMAQVDPATRTYGNTFRGLYRLALKGLVPEAVRLRRDKASGEALLGEAISGAEAQRTLESLSTVECLAARDLVDPASFREPFCAWRRALANRLGAGAQSEWHQVWRVLAVESFLRARDRARDRAGRERVS
jgi:hypothetical protein